MRHDHVCNLMVATDRSAKSDDFALPSTGFEKKCQTYQKIAETILLLSYDNQTKLDAKHKMSNNSEKSARC